MRVFLSALAILATLGLTALPNPAHAAGKSGTRAAATFSTQLDIHANSMSGAAFTAPQAGTYRFTIASGAFSYVTPRPGTTSQYGGWLTKLDIFAKEVTWGPEDRWGKHPINPDATVGDSTRQPTAAEADAAGRGATVTLNLKQGVRVTLLVSDGSKYYRDNQGSVKVQVALETP